MARPYKIRPYVASLTSSTLSSVLILLYFEYIRHASTVGSLQWLLPLPGIFFSQLSPMVNLPSASPWPICVFEKKSVSEGISCAVKSEG